MALLESKLRDHFWRLTSDFVEHFEVLSEVGLNIWYEGHDGKVIGSDTDTVDKKREPLVVTSGCAR